MPYDVRKSNGRWAVISDKGTTIGRHANKRDAIQQKIAVELEEGIK